MPIGSFTKGIATAAVVLGSNCRNADVCATLVGNHTFSPDPGIRQILAEEIDPAADIRGHLITAAIGQLAPANGVAEARLPLGRGADPGCDRLCRSAHESGA